MILVARMPDLARRGTRSAALLFVVALWSTPLMAIEEPVYTLIERQEPFEVREYQSYVVAETLVDGTFDSVGSEGFRRLFRYISGANREAARIAMTAPVEQAAAGTKISMTAPVEQQRAGRHWRIAFVLPASYTLASAPRPTDDRIAISEVPARRVAVVRYSGTWGQARYDSELAALRHFIGERGLRAIGEPVFSRYNPPFMPWFLRRNEIQVPVQAPGALSG
ncbi:MAG: heme-binding protein [Steroidobacteraceae bacterium]